MPTIQLRSPYLLFLGDERRPTYAKTARGLVDWRPELCLGQLRLTDETLDLGLADMSVAEAVDAGAGSLIIGTALVGGGISGDWIEILGDAARRGLDVVAGLHTPLSGIPALVDAAAEGGGRLVDIRQAPAGLKVATGERRSGKRLLTVGTDCALGKKYTALQLECDMRRRGFTVDFRASGQTGIMIAGQGIPIDCVVGDFIAGAAEALSPANDPDHWDLIEGQGSLYHPGYAAVSLGLLLGSQPDVFVVCHEAGRHDIEGWPGFALPALGALITRTTDLGRLTNPSIRCLGISVNTRPLPEAERLPYLEALSREHGLPCIDPLLTGTDALIDALDKDQSQSRNHP